MAEEYFTIRNALNYIRKYGMGQVRGGYIYRHLSPLLYNHFIRLPQRGGKPKKKKKNWVQNLSKAFWTQQQPDTSMEQLTLIQSCLYRFRWTRLSDRKVKRSAAQDGLEVGTSWDLFHLTLSLQVERLPYYNIWRWSQRPCACKKKLEKKLHTNERMTFACPCKRWPIQWQSLAFASPILKANFCRHPTTYSRSS